MNKKTDNKAKQIWDNCVKMGAKSCFDEDSFDWQECARCRISGYLNALSDNNIIPEDEQEEVYGKVWVWFDWNKKQLKRGGKI